MEKRKENNFDDPLVTTVIYDILMKRLKYFNKIILFSFVWYCQIFIGRVLVFCAIIYFLEITAKFKLVLM